jgi:hypothetical protein
LFGEDIQVCERGEVFGMDDKRGKCFVMEKLRWKILNVDVKVRDGEYGYNYEDSGLEYGSW